MATLLTGKQQSDNEDHSGCRRRKATMPDGQVDQPGSLHCSNFGEPWLIVREVVSIRPLRNSKYGPNESHSRMPNTECHHHFYHGWKCLCLRVQQDFTSVSPLRSCHHGGGSGGETNGGLVRALRSQTRVDILSSDILLVKSLHVIICVCT